VRQANSHDILYNVSQASRKKKRSRIDRGANGGIAGIDTKVIERHPHRTVDIRGINNHEITSISIVTAGAVARSQRGDVILIMHQCMPITRNEESQFILLLNWNLLPMMSTISQFTFQGVYNVSRLLTVMFSLSVFEMDYHI
jgi:hypothetical protein